MYPFNHLQLNENNACRPPLEKYPRQRKDHSGVRGLSQILIETLQLNSLQGNWITKQVETGHRSLRGCGYILKLVCVHICVCVYLGLQMTSNVILVGFRGPHTRSERDLAMKLEMVSWGVKKGRRVHRVPQCETFFYIFLSHCDVIFQVVASRGLFFRPGKNST